MNKYRIWSIHCGDPSERYKVFEAKNDTDAERELSKVRNSKGSGHPNYTEYWLERIDTEEKTTRL